MMTSITHISIALIFLALGLIIGLDHRERRWYTEPRADLPKAELRRRKRLGLDISGRRKR
jgi:hypothetical protein